MNNIEELTSKARIERIKSMFEIAKSYSSDQLTVPMPDLEALIAQLEAAQGSIKELESKVNHYVAAEYAHKHFDQTAEIIKRADSAELELVKVKAELSAVNEKLLVPVKLPERHADDDGWMFEDPNGDWLSFAKVNKAIKEAGFTFAVEGNSDAE
ncbi:Uncharacterised protein [Yersinia intermedia]|uniref:hypothetical protein n=1 Tax=Yersinia intermedia TaxID=631 RepID=UPI0005E001CB|nr:hypothetical protein [Yersinia intermedia]CNJ78652.1 Uncharacterised protein [Yersinia intermedia]